MDLLDRIEGAKPNNDPTLNKRIELALQSWQLADGSNENRRKVLQQLLTRYAICKKHGLKFDFRILYVNPGTLRLQEDLVTSFDSQEEIERKVNAAKVALQETENAINPLQQAQTDQEEMVSVTPRGYRVLQKARKMQQQPEQRGPEKKKEAYEALMRARATLRKTREQLAPLDEKAEGRTMPLNELAGRPQPITCSQHPPTWGHYCAEDRVEKMDIGKLLKNTDGHRAGLSGSDYGAVKTSVTVPQTLDTIQWHIDLYKQASVRERRLEQTQNLDIRTAFRDLASNSAMVEDTTKQVDLAHAARKKYRTILHEFEHSRGRQNDMRKQELRNSRAYDVLCAEERKQVQEYTAKASDSELPRAVSTQDGYRQPCGLHHLPEILNGQLSYSAVCPKSRPNVLPVMLTGTAGTGVGSRIRGHQRRGGGRQRKAQKIWRGRNDQ
ncbi:MAG: hypothetical protein J3Q66DRAFT_396864 [Benniella sp.]|nr:MAG: hypothetical protein J3Q66DRAFT_396864 [Benniella sp.]